jgi:hypothetical protein
MSLEIHHAATGATTMTEIDATITGCDFTHVTTILGLNLLPEDPSDDEPPPRLPSEESESRTF